MNNTLTIVEIIIAAFVMLAQVTNIILTILTQRNIHRLEESLNQDIKRIERIKDLINGTSIASHNIAFTSLFGERSAPDELYITALTQIWCSITEMKAITRVVGDSELSNTVDKMEERARTIPTHNGQTAAEWIVAFEEDATATYEASEKALNKITKKQKRLREKHKLSKRQTRLRLKSQK